jgi:hypothetical protein
MELEVGAAPAQLARGLHVGLEPILGLLRRLASLQPVRDDAYDIAESEHHAVLMTRLVGSGLDSHHVIVLVAEGGRLARAFHHVFDLYAFDETFRPPAAADPAS